MNQHRLTPELPEIPQTIDDGGCRPRRCHPTERLFLRQRPLLHLTLEADGNGTSVRPAPQLIVYTSSAFSASRRSIRGKKLKVVHVILEPVPTSLGTDNSGYRDDMLIDETVTYFE